MLAMISYCNNNSRYVYYIIYKCSGVYMRVIIVILLSKNITMRRRSSTRFFTRYVECVCVIHRRQTAHTILLWLLLCVYIYIYTYVRQTLPALWNEIWARTYHASHRWGHRRRTRLQALYAAHTCLTQSRLLNINIDRVVFKPLIKKKRMTRSVPCAVQYLYTRIQCTYILNSADVYIILYYTILHLPKSVDCTQGLHAFMSSALYSIH